MDLTRVINVKNRSSATVGYTLPDTGVSRNWTPGEIKKGVTVGELEQATFIPGGFKIIQDYLQIADPEVCEFLGIDMEPEYKYGEAEIRIMLESGTIEQFLDCLDFAPQGVLDLIKKIAVETKLNDFRKREAIKQKLGLDISLAISNAEFSSSKEDSVTPTRTRRAKPIVSEPSEGARRVEAPAKYNRVER